MSCVKYDATFICETWLDVNISEGDLLNNNAYYYLLESDVMGPRGEEELL